MNQTEMVRKLAISSGRSISESAEMFNDVLDVIADALIAGESAKLYGFGTFTPGVVSSQRKYNPVSKEYFMTKERPTVRFAPGDSLLKALT